MKARKFAALILAVLMLISCASVVAEDTPEATVQVTSAPVQITPAPTETPTEVPTEEPTEAPTEEPTEVPTEEPAGEPVMLMSEDEVTPEPEVPATEVPATEVPATDAPATEVPATEVPETEVPATEVPETEVPATDAPVTEVPATEVPATEVPATDAPVYEPVYAVIPADTELYADKALTEIFGELTGKEILYVVEENAETKLFAVIFDTEESIETDSVEIAYFRAEEEIEWLDEAETEKALETMKTFRKADGEFVPYIDFKYPEPDPTEAPTEEPTAEPTEEPVVDEDGLIIEDLAPVEPELPEEPATDEDGLIVEELVPAEPEASVEPEVPAEPEASVEPEVPAEPEASVEPEAPVEPEIFDELPSVEDVLITETSPEDTVIETESPEVAAPECSVVASMYGSSETVSLGDMVTVKAELIGYEGLTYTCEWECAATDETGAVTGEWQATGITELEHSFVLDEMTAQLAWRLRTVVEA